jgi:hypothetical protein
VERGGLVSKSVQLVKHGPLEHHSAGMRVLPASGPRANLLG